MTLGEFIKDTQLPDGAFYYIGAKNGSSFYFIGTAEEYEKNIRSMSWMEHLRQTRRQHRNPNERTEISLKEWRPFDRREVIESYPRISKDGIVVLTSGYEQGLYVIRSEIIKELKTGDSDLDNKNYQKNYYQKVKTRKERKKRELESARKRAQRSREKRKLEKDN